MENELSSKYAEYGRTFVYDPTNQMFIVGNGSGKSKEFFLQPREPNSAIVRDLFDFNGHESELPLGLVRRERPYFLVTAGWDIDVQPALRKYLEGLSGDEWRSLREMTNEVIAKVVEGFGIRARLDQGGFMGISTRPHDEGNVILTTVGNCACMGREAYKTHHGEFSSDFPQTYGLHNTDMPWQRLSLYAGLGALAWYAEVETARDI